MPSTAQRDDQDPEKIIGWQIHQLSKLTEFVQKVTTSVAREPAQVFEKALLELDELRLIAGNVAAEGVKLFLWTLGYTLQPSGRQETRIEGANRWLSEFVKREGSTAKMAKIINNTLAELVRQPSFAQALVTVNFVSVPAMWTALECLARDLWVHSLNNSSASVAHKAFRALESDDIQRKFIAVSDLAKYGFDVRHRVGNILASKFIFTDFEGIRRAFRVLHPTSNLTSDTNARALFLLEKTRHLIVHRAGFIDEKFKRETGERGPIDTRITLTAEEMQEWIDAVIVVGMKMIRMVDSHHHSNPRPA